MDTDKFSIINYGKAICYSGYRQGQSPDSQTYPSRDEVREDLQILKDHWQYIRLYDCSKHAEIVLELIREDNLDLKVMLGASIGAEVSNDGCPWGGKYSPESLAENRRHNETEMGRLIDFANQYPDTVFSLSIGNEASVDWTDHMVPVERLIEYSRMIKKSSKQPVTFCENYVPWLGKLEALVDELDFISLHTYPIWEYKRIDEAIEYTKDNYNSVARKYPDKQVVITEAGWATGSNGRGICPDNANEELQKAYFNDLINWTEEEGIITFVFEAFDEPWKGSPDPMEPEKHWGLFTVDRKPKKVMEALETRFV